MPTSSPPPPPPPSPSPSDVNSYEGLTPEPEPRLPVWADALITLTISTLVLCGFGYFLARPTVCDFGQPRSQVSRVKSDHRSLATAIETYYVDHGEYPAWSSDPLQSAAGIAYNGKKSKTQPWSAPTFQMRHGTQLETLTTPVAYITSFFADPFAEERGRAFCYYSRRVDEDTAGWILYSPGPDGDIDMTETDYDPGIPQPSALIIALRTYDPTNGTASDGDIWRIRQ